MSWSSSRDGDVGDGDGDGDGVADLTVGGGGQDVAGGRGGGDFVEKPWSGGSSVLSELLAAAVPWLEAKVASSVWKLWLVFWIFAGLVGAVVLVGESGFCRFLGLAMPIAASPLTTPRLYMDLGGYGGSHRKDRLRSA